MLACFCVSEPVSFHRIRDLGKGFTVHDQRVHQQGRVPVVDILVDRPVNDQQPVRLVREMLYISEML